MAILPIVKLFQPNLDYNGSCLRTEALDVLDTEFSQKWFQNLVFDMFHTLYSYPSGIGLSANQVGILKKISVIDIKHDGKNPTILINPKYTPLSDKKNENVESCLSFPNLSVPVSRYNHILVNYQDIHGECKVIELDGFKAIVFQHEIDHLYGIVHVDIATKIENIVFYEGKSSLLAKKSTTKLFNKG